MEKEAAVAKPKGPGNILDDDSQVAVFAAYMATGEGMETVDPKKIEEEKKKAAQAKVANEELNEL